MLDTDLARALGMERPTNIRTMIKGLREELERFGVLHAERANSSDALGRGRPATAYHLNEEQAAYVTMHCKTEKATEVKVLLVRVFTAWRHGKLVPAQPMQSAIDFINPLETAKLIMAEMTTKTSTFSFAGLDLRCVTIEGQPLFVAEDVCRMTGLEGYASKHTAKLPIEERRVVSAATYGTLGIFKPKQPSATLVSEKGLYTLVMRAQKANPKAREFQSWVTGTVLPTIRQTGGYIQGEEKLATGEMTEEQFFALAVLTMQGQLPPALGKTAGDPPSAAPSPCRSRFRTTSPACWTRP
ncbi:BRO family protein [Methylobacterium radiodurans]|uniref:BRO family protein n=1 Tax=Methylobacterium radiodurans TaxID=2202828 RepID=UPI0013A5BD76|nr:BRO family protein [Methylobacterium radiodurans]